MPQVLLHSFSFTLFKAVHSKSSRFLEVRCRTSGAFLIEQKFDLIMAVGSSFILISSFSDCLIKLFASFQLLCTSTASVEPINYWECRLDGQEQRPSMMLSLNILWFQFFLFSSWCIFRHQLICFVNFVFSSFQNVFLKSDGFCIFFSLCGCFFHSVSAAVICLCLPANTVRNASYCNLQSQDEIVSLCICVRLSVTYTK